MPGLMPYAYLRGCDRLVTGGVLFLIVFPPLAFGAVHPWAVALMEVTVFLLLAVWMGKLLCFSTGFFPFPRLALPLLLFVGFILLQVLPLPPSVLRLLSPSAYTLHATSLPGWPERSPYADLTPPRREGSAVDVQPRTPVWTLLPTVEEARRELAASPAPLNRDTKPDASKTRNSQVVTSTASVSYWRTLSLAPGLTKTDLLKFCAYAALFLLVCCYPFGSAQRREGMRVTTDGRGRPEEGEAEQRFVRLVLLTVLSSGLLVACLGLLQQITWNGKLLWFFVPYDWGAPRPALSLRASGPFVNPDHFANYLMLSFPLAIVGAFSPGLFSTQGRRRRFQLFCGGAALVLCLGILLSLSRGGWIAALLATGILLWTFHKLPRDQRSSRFNLNAARTAAIGLILLGGLGLLCVGASGRGQIISRLQETFTGDASLRIRLTAWQGSLAMIQDFPFLGVGLGAWPELFQQYRQPPWSALFYREAHNDYLELVAETGLLGCVLLAWFFWRGGRRLVRGLRTVSPRFLPYLAALLAACGGMALHEGVDANLQVPANALLFTVLFGLALRLTGAKEMRDQSQNAASQYAKKRWSLSPVAFTGAVSLLLLTVALRQESLSYPHEEKESTSLTEAKARIVSQPTRASAHLTLARLLQQHASPARWLEELRIAVWLDPGNPEVRDFYAHSLLQQGKEKEGLYEISQSVFFSPTLATHAYLEPRILPWLSAKEHKAVEEGLQQAVALGLAEAVQELGAFYHLLGRFTEEGALYETAAPRYPTPQGKADVILRAARAYAQAGALDKAETLFRHAADLIPADPGPYHYLALWIFAPRKDLRSAQSIIAEGIQQGADPVALSLSLAEAAKKIGNLEEAEAALLRALALRPSSYDTHIQLGLLYLQQSRAGRAALALRRATELNPGSAEAFYYLGVAEEARAQFLAAENAYARAVALAPDNLNFRKQYEEFLYKLHNQHTRAARR